MTIQELDPSLDVDGTCSSTPCWSRQRVITNWRTGPTALVCPLIHPISSESWWSRGNVYSLHDLVVPPNPSSTSWVVWKYCLTETFLMNPFANPTYFLSLLITFQVFLDGCAVDPSLLEQSSQVFVPTNSLPEAPIFDTTADFSMLRNDWPSICWVN